MVVLDIGRDLVVDSLRAGGWIPVGVDRQIAPDTGSWTFPVKIDARRLRTSLQTSPKSPQHAARFAAFLSIHVAGTGEVLASGRVSCSASIAARTLRALAVGFIGTRARCVWHVPLGTRGKTLRGTIAVAVTPAARVSRRFAFSVR